MLSSQWKKKPSRMMNTTRKRSLLMITRMPVVLLIEVATVREVVTNRMVLEEVGVQGRTAHATRGVMRLAVPVAHGGVAVAHAETRTPDWTSR
eukprot:scaffold8721_cov67-Skeletonema_dohrnii-CCMP3373.AAC.2